LQSSPITINFKNKKNKLENMSGEGEGKIELKRAKVYIHQILYR